MAWAWGVLVVVGLWAVWWIARERRVQRAWEDTPLAAKKKSWVKSPPPKNSWTAE